MVWLWAVKQRGQYIIGMVYHVEPWGLRQTTLWDHILPSCSAILGAGIAAKNSVVSNICCLIWNPEGFQTTSFSPLIHG